MRTSLLLIVFTCLFLNNHANSQDKQPQLDVTDYHALIIPDFENQSIKGTVIITLNAQVNTILLDKGNCEILSVTGDKVKSFRSEKKKLIVELSDRLSTDIQLKISYVTKPIKGLIFTRESEQIHTVYHTDHWMICNMNVHDRATITLELIIPNKLVCIANGKLTKQAAYDDKKTSFRWEQDFATPAYTYGFVVGSFQKYRSIAKGVKLDYYSSSYSADSLRMVFDKSADILSFLVEKSGVNYHSDLYSQILIGNHYQEMSGFSILKTGYGDYTLKDSTETNLITHEFAHQWWGNMITCKSLGHFWLNEGFATYMSAAYNEYRFGQEKYLADIDAYYQVYEKIKSANADKPLVFSNWNNPSGYDRNIVYFKAAYVLHLLRQELGDDLFWKGIKAYSQEFYGKSVTTDDFQKAMEKSSGKQLETFFQKWVY